jgi:TRAP-type C4-dicarboxylate transport system permease small subunit
VEATLPLSAVSKWIDRLTDCALGITVAVTSAAVIAQVVLRYAFDNSLGWVDEFATLLFAWMIMVGAAVAQRTDSHMSVEVFVRMMPYRARVFFFLVRMAACLGVLAVLFWQGWSVTMQMSFIEYSAMGISRGYLYSVLPVCIPFITFYVVTTLIRGLRQIRRGVSAYDRIGGITTDAKAEEER